MCDISHDRLLVGASIARPPSGRDHHRRLPLPQRPYRSVHHRARVRPPPGRRRPAGRLRRPPTDFRLYDTAYTERYLGLPQDNPEGYADDCPLTDTPGLTGPLPLIHGLADDNAHSVHTLPLSQALTRAGRPHSVLPLPGVTHMTPGGTNEQLAMAELAFLRRFLG
ncbi:alpha/beta hydrolase family protein [Kitasatospora sp. NPDC001159]